LLSIIALLSFFTKFYSFNRSISTFSSLSMSTSHIVLLSSFSSMINWIKLLTFSDLRFLGGSTWSYSIWHRRNIFALSILKVSYLISITNIRIYYYVNFCLCQGNITSFSRFTWITSCKYNRTSIKIKTIKTLLKCKYNESYQK